MSDADDLADLYPEDDVDDGEPDFSSPYDDTGEDSPSGDDDDLDDTEPENGVGDGLEPAHV